MYSILLQLTSPSRQSTKVVTLRARATTLAPRTESDYDLSRPIPNNANVDDARHYLPCCWRLAVIPGPELSQLAWAQSWKQGKPNPQLRGGQINDPQTPCLWAVYLVWRICHTLVRAEKLSPLAPVSPSPSPGIRCKETIKTLRLIEGIRYINGCLPWKWTRLLC